MEKTTKQIYNKRYNDKLKMIKENNLDKEKLKEEERIKREENKAKNKAKYNKTYYDKNHDELSLQRKVKIKCYICDCSINSSSKYEHVQTKMHKKNEKKYI